MCVCVCVCVCVYVCVCVCVMDMVGGSAVAPRDTYILLLGPVEMLPYVAKGALQMNLGSS